MAHGPAPLGAHVIFVDSFVEVRPPVDYSPAHFIVQYIVYTCLLYLSRAGNGDRRTESWERRVRSLEFGVGSWKSSFAEGGDGSTNLVNQIPLVSHSCAHPAFVKALPPSPRRYGGLRRRTGALRRADPASLRFSASRD